MEMDNENLFLGIDIGSTNLCAVVFDSEKRKTCKVKALPNNSAIKGEADLAEFDAEIIIKGVISMAEELVSEFPEIKAIGVTGQMHGAVYLSEEGRAVSPFFSWQDGRGNRLFSENRTYAEKLKELTGYSINTGYAFLTLFYNKQNGIEPSEAYSFASIADLAVMALTGRKTPLIHPSFAASFGLFDVENNCFDVAAIKKAGLSHLVLPEIVKGEEFIGYFKNIPVSPGIGDNQASFFGSVKNEKDSALLNFGTGSQVSVALDKYKKAEGGLEVRPYLFRKYLLCGSALCGGKAYAIAERFFSEYAKALGHEEGQYEILNELARKAYEEGEALSVSTLFCGTRENPSLRGRITGIDDINFTPGNLLLGFLCGMAEELKGLSDLMEKDDILNIVASGNAVKKNPTLCKILEDVFNAKVELTPFDEEAAIGAALYGKTSLLYQKTTK